MLTYRQISETDIPALTELCMATENNLGGRNGTTRSGVDPGAYLDRLGTDCAGWTACVDGETIAFAVANRSKGELWGPAVLPEHRRRGLGRELMRQAEAWLFSHGWEEIRLVAHAGENPDAVGLYHHLGWVEWKTEEDLRFLKKVASQSVIKLEEHMFTDPNTGYTRIVRLQRGPSDQPHRLCLLLDGEHYWRDMDAVPILSALSEAGQIPRMTFAFVGHVSGAARHEDYTCNERYGRFIGESVMTWLKREVPSLQDHGHLIAGLSLSGLMATYLTLQYPQHFSYCLSQSGSHWWEYEWFAEMARRLAPNNGQFWLSVGDQETQENVKHAPSDLFQEISQMAGVQKAAGVLKEIGGAVRYHQYEGGHTIPCWRNELGEALTWLLNERENS